MKRPLCVMALSFLSGILFGRYPIWYLLGAAVIAFLGMICSFRKIQKAGMYPKRVVHYALILITPLLFFAGSLRYREEVQFRESYMSCLAEGKRIEVQGILTDKEEKNGQTLYYLNHCYISINEKIVPCNQILIYPNSDNQSIGKTLIVKGTTEYWSKAVNEGNFDADTFYKQKKIDFKLKNCVILSEHGKTDFLKKFLHSLRNKLRNLYETQMSAEDAGVLSVMILGDKSLLDTEIKKQYQKAGVSHVLAISGLHISVIGMGLYKLLRKIKLSFFEAGAVSGGILFCYGILAGFGTSTKRAVMMFLLLLAAQWIGRSYDSISAAGAAAIFILWENPYLLWYAGFLFSFAAVLGVVGIGQLLTKIQKPYFKFGETLLMSFSIQIVTLPLTAYFYFEIPGYALIANLFILPILGLLLTAGLSGGFIGMLSTTVAGAIFSLCHVILSFYYNVCELTGMMPGASLIVGRPRIWKLVLYYGMLLFFLWNCRRKKSRTGFVIISVILMFFLLWNPKGKFELDALDVGQGDGSFLRTEQGQTLFFDGGSTDVSKVGEYRILPFLKSKGISYIDYWVVSHTDADHISGLEEILLERYRVKNLVISAYMIEDDASYKLLSLAKENNVNIIELKQGDSIVIGEAKLSCIFPDSQYKVEDKNARSMVVRYEEAGFSGLFCGDISSLEEKYMLEQKMIESVDYFKAAHHGSKSSNSKEFLSELSPELTVISCGKNNRYGHPGKEAVKHMEECGSSIYYTMNQGEITLVRKENKIFVQNYVEPLAVTAFPVLE